MGDGRDFEELFGCRLPLQLAVMGGVGTRELAAAVTASGGLGMVPAPASADRVPALLERTRETAEGPVGIGFLIPFLKDGAVEAAAEAADVVEFFWGDPAPDLVRVAGTAGAVVGWQVGSAPEAIAAADAGCQYVVAQGIEAGGHVWGRERLDDLLAETLDAVDVPVLAAGGIGTAARVSSLLRTGAAGVRVGTRFLAAAESNAHPRYVEALIAARKEDTVLTETFGEDWPGAPHRVLRRAIEEVAVLDEEIVGILGDWQIPRFSSVPPLKRVEGHVMAMACYAGESVDAVTEVKRASEIIDELVGTTENS